ncbi:MAG: hypothetical protein WBQ04_00235 [Candidatus Acidiferrales bacterium]
MKPLLLAALLAIPICVNAQGSVPIGTVLPVRLDSSLSTKSMPGQVVKATVMQDVPLGNGAKIPTGSKVVGQVTEVTPGSAGTNTQISLKFDRLVSDHHTVSIITDLRALASNLEVEDAQLPDANSDRGTPSNAYTTVQVGDNETVYRGGGHVMNGSERVGEPVLPNGVLVHVRPNSTNGCRGLLRDNEPPQALWVFASDACGVHGYSHLKILNSGRNAPLGQIVLAVDGRSLNVRAGSGMLLRIVGANSSAPQASKIPFVDTTSLYGGGGEK